MRLILWLLALSAAAVAVVFAAKYNDGYVLLVKQPYQIELALNIFIMALIAAFFIFYIAVRLLLRIFNFNQRHRHKKANVMMTTGLKSFFEGDYATAKKTAPIAFKNADSSAIKAINAVIAARSAHKLEEFSQRDNYLNMAAKDAPDERALRLVTQAELLLDQGHPHQALETLQSLYSTGGLQQTAVLQLELKAQQQAGNWNAVLELTELLQKRRPVNKALIKEIRLHAHIENIKKHATDLPSLNKYWHHLSTEEKTDSKLAIAATRAYMALGNCDMAHEIIEHSITTDWNPELIILYSECLDYHVSRQIEKAEVWLKAQPNNAQLLLTLGKLCTHCELWGKAQNYLEASLSVEQNHAAHLALAQLHEKLGKHELAMDQYNKGLGLTLKKLS